MYLIQGTLPFDRLTSKQTAVWAVNTLPCHMDVNFYENGLLKEQTRVPHQVQFFPIKINFSIFKIYFLSLHETSLKKYVFFGQKLNSNWTTNEKFLDLLAMAMIVYEDKLSLHLQLQVYHNQPNLAAIVVPRKKF